MLGHSTRCESRPRRRGSPAPASTDTRRARLCAVQGRATGFRRRGRISSLPSARLALRVSGRAVGYVNDGSLCSHLAELSPSTESDRQEFRAAHGGPQGATDGHVSVPPGAVTIPVPGSRAEMTAVRVPGSGGGCGRPGGFSGLATAGSLAAYSTCWVRLMVRRRRDGRSPSAGSTRRRWGELGLLGAEGEARENAAHPRRWRLTVGVEETPSCASKTEIVVVPSGASMRLRFPSTLGATATAGLLDREVTSWVRLTSWPAASGRSGGQAEDLPTLRPDVARLTAGVAAVPPRSWSRRRPSRCSRPRSSIGGGDDGDAARGRRPPCSDWVSISVGRLRGARR